MKKIRPSIIVFVLAVLIFVGMYFTVITGKREQIKVRKQELKTLETKLSKTIAVVKRKKEANRKLKIVSAKWHQAQKMLPTEASISTLLNTLTKRSTKSEVMIKHLKPTGKSSREKYDEIRIEMQVNGTFHNIASFMAALNNMERIVNVKNLELSPVRSESEEEIELSATFDLLTYLTKGGKIEG